MKFDRKSFSDSELIFLYKSLLKPRLIEEKMLILLRQGIISKWFSGMGQEAISVGATLAMEKEEYILPMHRNLGIFTSRDIPMERLFAQFQGKKSGFTKGRDRSFHFGSIEHKIVGMISHLGPQLSIADGIALACKLKNENNATLVFTGDGGASEGEFHEALNLAAVWDLPVIFAIENNQWGLSTPSSEQFRCKSFTDKGIGYGMQTMQLDGNNILEVYDGFKNAASFVRDNSQPILVECMTFRMRGHEEASGTKYYPEGLIEAWSKQDPIVNYEEYLLQQKIITKADIKKLKEEIKKEIDQALFTASREETISPDIETEVNDLYFSNEQKLIEVKIEKSSEKRFVDAVRDAMLQSLKKYPDLIIMGQDIAEYGGVFKATDGFVGMFGKDRIRNTPLCESAIIGAGLGLSIKKMKSVIEMQFADFVTCGFNQIVNNLAKTHYRWGQNADVVIRMPTGAGVGAGPFHSQSNEAWFFHTPGLKIVYPSNPTDAKGLLNAAIEDPNPYLYFEHKALYRSVSEEIPDDYYTMEVGKARLVSEGQDLSIITYGMGVHWAREITEKNNSISADILDLRTLLPWDKEAVEKTVKKTNKVIIVHEDCLTGGIGAEIAAWISENCFKHLDAPVMREGSLDTPVPFSSSLEENFLPKQRLKDKIDLLLKY
ncbi:dehydrogenase E1 component subunit alpha/beta [Reichenbachiella sp. MALMAid0571]|uniref:alpha-ketoacid dehydrogenase subunit alpha/beta n=1 Tax=Reichenbachiella sp. MALMAid0571 TaxID=3143939 RepID=UPI0032DE96B5